MNKRITVTLTEDQYHYLIECLLQDIDSKQKYADSVQMGLDPNFVAFNKRLQTALAKAKS